MARLNKVKYVEIETFGRVPLEEGTFKSSGFKREHKKSVGNAADGGFSETNEPASLKITVLSHSYLDSQALGAIVDKQVTVTMANGAKHIMVRAYAEETPEEKDGTFELSLIANVSQKIK